MRYVYAHFKGYIGFYSGLGMEEVSIDLSKAKTGIILIHGINGCGKSTLNAALNPFPDPSSSFVPNMDAEKHLIIDSDGDIYDIDIVSPADINGGRKTKAFIKKNGLELNSNGNITSFKEIIFSEFELDSNYIALSKLSGDDKGMGQKTPSERKKFASNIIENLEFFNNMHKELNKRSSIFKSRVNNLHTKIQNIGSRESIEVTLKGLKLKEADINSRLLDLNNQIVSIETRASINQEEILKIQGINNDLQSIQMKTKQLKADLVSYSRRTHISEDELDDTLNNNISLSADYGSKLEQLRLEWTAKSTKMVSDSQSLEALRAQLDAYESDIDRTLEEKYSISNRDIKNMKYNLSKSNIQYNENEIDTTLFILSGLVDFYTKFINRIDVFYDGLSQADLEYIVLHYSNNDMNILNDQLDSLMMNIDTTIKTIENVNKNIVELKVLDNRPDGCNINTCPFIASAYELKQSLGNTDLEEELSKLQRVKKELSYKVTETKQKIEIQERYVSKRTEYDILRAAISEKLPALQIFGDKLLSNLGSFDIAVANMNMFNEQRDPSRLTDTLNLLKSLKYELESNKTLELAYNSYKDKLKLIDTTKAMIDTLDIEVTNLTKEVSELKSQIDNFNSLKVNLDNNIQIQKQYLSVYNSWKEWHNKEVDLLNKIADIEKKSSDTMKSIESINLIRSDINRLQSELSPIVNDISRLNGQLTILESYYQEYEQYKSKYDMIEILKKYCSPSGGDKDRKAIQVIFMNMYMSETLDIANQVLGMLFGGQYSLLPFVINENEFRLPFIGPSGMPVDDISSGSLSQVCMMGMVINLTLLYRGSTKFNIARLDEIDQSLDHRNRLEFNGALFKIKELLKFEQIFLISHSIEADSSNVDIIKLKSYDDFESINLCGNIIYDYAEEYKKTIQ